MTPGELQLCERIGLVRRVASQADGFELTATARSLLAERTPRVGGGQSLTDWLARLDAHREAFPDDRQHSLGGRWSDRLRVVR